MHSMVRQGGRVPRLPYTNPTFATDIHLMVGTQKESTKNMDNNLLGHKRLPACSTGALFTIQARQPYPCQRPLSIQNIQYKKGDTYTPSEYHTKMLIRVTGTEQWSGEGKTSASEYPVTGFKASKIVLASMEKLSTLSPVRLLLHNWTLLTYIQSMFPICLAQKTVNRQRRK